MLSNAQKALIKRAQREAHLDDADYRECLETVTDCTSSTDPRLNDRSFDIILQYFEAIFWGKVDSGELQRPCNTAAVFAKRQYWAFKNPRDNTSRERFTLEQLQRDITDAEAVLLAAGYSEDYCMGIYRKAAQSDRPKYDYSQGNAVGRQLRNYLAALRRTVASKAPAPAI